MFFPEEMILAHWGEKVAKVQPMRLLIVWGRQFEDAFDEKHSGEKSNNCNRCRYAFSQPDNLRTHLITYRGGDHTNVTSVTMHSLVQPIWVTHLKHIGENSRTNATNMKMHHLMEAIKRHPIMQMQEKLVKSSQRDHVSYLLSIWGNTW